MPVLQEERRDCKGQVDDSREEESEGECNLQGLVDEDALICSKKGATKPRYCEHNGAQFWDEKMRHIS